MIKTYTKSDIEDFEHRFVILEQNDITLYGVYVAKSETFCYQINSLHMGYETDILAEALDIFNTLSHGKIYKSSL